MAYRNLPVVDYATVVDASAQLIDVRQPDEVASGTLDGATNIPLDQLAARLGELDPNKCTVLFCRSGARSAQAAEFLTEAHFADVVNLDGGMLVYTAGDDQ